MSNNNLLILVCLFDLGLGPEVHSCIPTKRLVQYLFLLGSKKNSELDGPTLRFYQKLMSVTVLSQELILILCIILTPSALLEFHMFKNQDG